MSMVRQFMKDLVVYLVLGLAAPLKVGFGQEIQHDRVQDGQARIDNGKNLEMPPPGEIRAPTPQRPEGRGQGSYGSTAHRRRTSAATAHPARQVPPEASSARQ